MGPKSTSTGAGAGAGAGTGAGEIVQVQGGHILRATGRKDRHSKVFTAKGARDRRVRLAAHTAIQFYDVQDRLGYDRPSKAVDWLINKAKASIDKLNELPPWDPTTFHRHALNNNNICSNNNNNNNNNNNENVDVDVNNDDNNDNVGSFSKQVSLGSGSGGGDSSTLGGGGVSQFCVPHCVDSSMMKSFFPTHHNTTTTTSSENDSLCFQNYPHELISRETAGHHQAQNLSQSQSQSQNRDLCLSLQTVDHDSGIGGHLGHLHQGQGQGHDQQNLFHQGGFVDGGWAQQQQDMGRLMGGILFNSSPPVVLSPQALLLNQQGLAMTNYFNQRSTLQSSYSALPRVFEDNQHHNHNHNQQQMSSIGHGSDSFMGFYIPSQVHGDLHGGATTMSNRASSSSLSPDSSQH